MSPRVLNKVCYCDLFFWVKKHKKAQCVGWRILDFVITCGSRFLINFKIREHPIPGLQKTFRNKLTIRSGVFENFQTTEGCPPITSKELAVQGRVLWLLLWLICSRSNWLHWVFENWGSHSSLYPLIQELHWAILGGGGKTTHALDFWGGLC